MGVLIVHGGDYGCNTGRGMVKNNAKERVIRRSSPGSAYRLCADGAVHQSPASRVVLLIVERMADGVDEARVERCSGRDGEGGIMIEFADWTAQNWWLLMLTAIAIGLILRGAKGT